MSGAWLRRVELVTTTSEIVGTKSGLALSKAEMDPWIPGSLQATWGGPGEGIVRVRPEEFEEIIATILFRVGNIPSPSTCPPLTAVFHKYKDSTRDLEIFLEVAGRWPDFLNAAVSALEASGEKALDPTPFIEESRIRHGGRGLIIAVEIVLGLDLALHRSPWSWYSRVEWSDTRELQDLFTSENLKTQYGTFFDQRFIDYLAQNFGDIDKINWRQFEALTSEHFVREGFHVEIGKGRDDDNIDVRVWHKGSETSAPPAILVQCKREKNKIEKVVVKALYADILHEQAESGVVVTTSCLSPGASKTCTARAYPITQAKRETVRKWLLAMRTPFAGVFLGE